MGGGGGAGTHVRAASTLCAFPANKLRFRILKMQPVTSFVFVCFGSLPAPLNSFFRWRGKDT